MACNKIIEPYNFIKTKISVRMICQQMISALRQGTDGKPLNNMTLSFHQNAKSKGLHVIKLFDLIIS